MKYKPLFLFFVFVPVLCLAQTSTKADKRKSPNHPSSDTVAVKKSYSNVGCILMPFETKGEQRLEYRNKSVIAGSAFYFDSNTSIDKQIYDLENDLIKQRADILNKIVNEGKVTYNIRTHSVSLSPQGDGKYKLSFRVSYHAYSKEVNTADVFLTMIDEVYLDGELKSDTKFHKLVHFKDGAVVASATLYIGKCELKLLFNPALYGLFKELDFETKL